LVGWGVVIGQPRRACFRNVTPLTITQSFNTLLTQLNQAWPSFFLSMPWVGSWVPR